MLPAGGRQHRGCIKPKPRWRKIVAEILWPVPEAAVTVLCTPDDVCNGHPKHVEWFSVNKYLHTVASCWILLIRSYNARNHEYIKKKIRCYLIQSFGHEADENSALMGHHAASSGSSLGTFRNIISVPYSRNKNSRSFMDHSWILDHWRWDR